jgi:hypothetical protein
MQDRGWNSGKSFKLKAGQPLLSMRLFAFCCSLVFRKTVPPSTGFIYPLHGRRRCPVRKLPELPFASG